MIKTITFDLWHTIIREPCTNYSQFQEEYRVEGIHRVLREHEYKVSIKDLRRAYVESGKRFREVWRKGIDLDTREQITIIMECINCDLSPSRDILSSIEKPYTEAMLENMPILIDHVADTLKTLREEGYHIGLICNTGRTPGKILRGILSKHNLVNYFDALTFSNEVGVRKPEKKIFELTLKKLGALPRSSVHIGDNPATDIMGAKNTGMKAILYTNTRFSDPTPQPKPDAIVREFCELPKIIKNMES